MFKNMFFVSYQCFHWWMRPEFVENKRAADSCISYHAMRAHIFQKFALLNRQFVCWVAAIVSVFLCVSERGTREDEQQRCADYRLHPGSVCADIIVIGRRITEGQEAKIRSSQASVCAQGMKACIAFGPL